MNHIHSTTRMRSAAAVAGLAAAVILAGCAAGPAASPAPSSDSKAAALLPQGVKDRGYISVVTDLTYPPFGILEDGTTPSGIDVDTAAALEKVLGIEVKVVNASFDAFIPGLQANRYDAGFNAISDIPERRDVVDFIDFNQYGGLFLTQPDSDIEIESAESACGYKVGAEQGSDVVFFLEGMQKQCADVGKPAIEVSVYGSQVDSLSALTSGRVEAVLGGSTSGYLADSSDGAYVVNGPIIPTHEGKLDVGGMALPKGSELTDAFLAAMTQLYEDGTLAKIYKSYGIDSDILIQPEVNAG